MPSQLAKKDSPLPPRDASDPAQLIRVVICGEVNAGKSTVLNAMAREALLPDNLGSASRPVVYVRHGDTRMLEITHANGQVSAHDDMVVPRNLSAAHRVDVALDQPHLKGIELIEVPMTTAEDLTEMERDIVRSAHVLIWVTIASQAWRLTEKTIVEVLGDARPARGILAVSRADKLRSKRDRDRLRDRMVRETSLFFSECIFVNGSRKQIARSGTARDVWTATGGAELLEVTEALGVLALAEMPPPAEPAATPEVVDFASFHSARGTAAGKVADPGIAAQEPLPGAETPAPETAEPVVAETAVETPVATPAEAVAEAAAVVEVAAPKRSATLEGDLRQLIADMAPSVSFGVVPQSDPGGCLVMNGSTSDGRAVANVCSDVMGAIGHAYAEETVCASVLTLGSRRLMLQEVPDFGMVFMLSDNDAMSFGIAQRMMNKACAACAAYA